MLSFQTTQGLSAEVRNLSANRRSRSFLESNSSKTEPIAFGIGSDRRLQRSSSQQPLSLSKLSQNLHHKIRSNSRAGLTPLTSHTPSFNAAIAQAAHTSLANAIPSPVQLNLNGQVNTTKSNDIYKITLDQAGRLTANLNGLTGDADVRLIQDKNGNGSIDAGEVIGWQWERGLGSEAISRFLQADTYYVQVMSHQGQTADYSLTTNFSASAIDTQNFSLNVRFRKGLTGLSETARQAILEAAAFWEEVIPQSSFAGSHTLTVNVRADLLSKNFLASASPNYWSRTKSLENDWLPNRGDSTINARYFRKYNKDPGFLKETMIHEFGHVLGIGTLWDGLIQPNQAVYRADTYAGQAYGELLGTNVPTAIPLTTGQGAGSDLSHWREEVLGNELMTHADNAGADPTSQITIAALRDLGWQVNYGAAEAYSLAGVQSSAIAPRSNSKTSSRSHVSFRCGCTAHLAGRSGLHQVGQSQLVNLV